MFFENRREAGKRLAAELTDYKNKKSIVLALPRGGIPVGFEIAEILHVPLEVFVSRKIGSPYNTEFGIGAIAEGNVRVLDKPTIKHLRISKEKIDEITKTEKEEIKRRVSMYRNNKPLPKLSNRTVILVDDGLATGITARAAILALKKKKVKQIIFASPVCSLDSARELRFMVDSVVCIAQPIDFVAVGSWYRNFPQVTDEEVVELLQKSKMQNKIKDPKLLTSLF